jgi:hypothetical protein
LGEVTQIAMKERQFWNLAALQPLAEKPWTTFMGRPIFVSDMPVDAQKCLGVFDKQGLALFESTTRRRALPAFADREGTSPVRTGGEQRISPDWEWHRILPSVANLSQRLAAQRAIVQRRLLEGRQLSVAPIRE